MKKLLAAATALLLLCAAVSCALADSYTLGRLRFDVPESWMGGFQEDSDDKILVLLNAQNANYFVVMLAYDDIGGTAGTRDASTIIAGLCGASAASESASDTSDVHETNGFYWFSFYSAEHQTTMVMAIDPDAKNALLFSASSTDGIEDVLNMITVEN